MNMSINDLRWLTGFWQGKHNSEHVDEMWSMPTGNTMVGTFRQFVGTDLTLYELIVIEEMQENIMMRIKHFGPQLAAWEDENESLSFRLEKLDGQKAQFVMQQTEGPEIMLQYVRREDELSVTMNTSTDSGVKTEEYTFSAVAT